MDRRYSWAGAGNVPRAPVHGVGGGKIATRLGYTRLLHEIEDPYGTRQGSGYKPITRRAVAKGSAGAFVGLGLHEHNTRNKFAGNPGLLVQVI